MFWNVQFNTCFAIGLRLSLCNEHPAMTSCEGHTPLPLTSHGLPFAGAVFVWMKANRWGIRKPPMKELHRVCQPTTDRINGGYFKEKINYSIGCVHKTKAVLLAAEHLAKREKFNAS